MSDRDRAELDKLNSVHHFSQILTTAERGFDADVYDWSRQRKIACYPVADFRIGKLPDLIADKPGSASEVSDATLETMVQNIRFKGDMVLFPGKETERKLSVLSYLALKKGVRILGTGLFFGQDLRKLFLEQSPVWMT